MGCFLGRSDLLDFDPPAVGVVDETMATVTGREGLALFNN